MRFFKYLVAVFVSIISNNLYADYWKYNDLTGSTAGSVCAAIVSTLPPKTFDPYPYKEYQLSNVTATSALCTHYDTQMRARSVATITFVKEEEKCPQKDTPIIYDFDETTGVPIRVCQKKGDKFCSYSREEASPVINLQSGNQRAILRSDYDYTIASCTEQKQGQCNRNDPYGKCYTPPNDGCTRTSNGSIICPPESPPPQPEQGCKNGATYCKRPPDGCGEGYVTGSFNGEQLCVKKGPNTPPDPNKPNDCTAANCPKPDDGYDCPVGYYATMFNGQKICVKDNPNNSTDPKDPTGNPNDPNSNGGNTGGNGGNTGGGDGGNTGDGNGNTGGNTGGEGGFCDSTGKALCDAVGAIKDFLTKEQTEKDEKTEVPTTEISEQSLSLDVFKANSSKCPADKHINLQTPFGTISKTFSFQDMCNETAWFGYIVLILAYSYAVNIVLRA